MKKKLRVLETFSGIGAPRKALMRGGYNFDIVDSIEIDPNPVKSYNAIYNENIIPQDITKWNKTKEELGEIDLLWNSSPCQDFSTAGKGTGGKEGSGTRSSLVYEVIRIAKEFMPKYIVWENVKGLITKKHKPILDDYINKLNELGYKSVYKVLNAKDYGVPQNRERVFTVSILGNDDYEFPSKEQLTTLPIDYIEENADSKYDLTEKNLKHYQRDFGSKGKELNLYEPIPTLVSAMGTGGGNIPYFTFPPKQELKLKLKDILDDEVDEKYYLSEKMMNYIKADNKKWTGNNGQALINKEIASTINTGEGHRRCDASNYISKELGDNINLKDVVRKYGIFDNKKSQHQAGSVYDKNGLSPTLDTMQGGYRQPCIEIKNNSNIDLNDLPLRIRKLTPKECWRLMGFDDSDFEKAEKVNSNTQLYKQAGNSVVVNVIEAIFNNLLKDYQ